MTPIRVGIIGLSPKAGAAWASRAHLPYLLSPAGRAKFQIIALCNSSVEAAKRAIEHFELPAETRAYGNPDDMAADPAVELVVNTTRVDKHYDTILPSVKAGKDVFVEWPLAHTAAKAEDLTALAKEKGSRTVVGLQGWFAPPVRKAKEIIESGRIGNVLSSEVKAAGGTPDRMTFPEVLKIFAEKQVGANVVTVTYGHMSDFVQFVLGDIQDPKLHVQIQRPEVNIVEVPSMRVKEVKKTDIPDLLFVTGSLPASSHVAPNATLHIRFRRGQAFKGEPAMVWTINGEKGEIRITASGPSGPAVQTGLSEVMIEIHDFEKDEVEKIDWDWGTWADLPATARNIGALYEAYAAGDESKYATFEHALRRQRTIDEILR
ncbi:NAD(P)-binding protein [Thozetella sp. PMI_491]|nr:NAD(P)-binding protein [Thozetella sp. PMI_491]